MDFRLVFHICYPYRFQVLAYMVLGISGWLLLRNTPEIFLFQIGVLFGTILLSPLVSFSKKNYLLLPIPGIRMARTVWFTNAIFANLF